MGLGGTQDQQYQPANGFGTADRAFGQIGQRKQQGNDAQKHPPVVIVLSVRVHSLRLLQPVSKHMMTHRRGRWMNFAQFF